MSFSRTHQPLQMQLPIDDIQDDNHITGSPVKAFSWADGRQPRELPEPFASQPERSQPRQEVVQHSPHGNVAKALPQPVALHRPMTSRQRNFLLALARELELSVEEVDLEIASLFAGKSLQGLDRREATMMIRSLQARAEWPVAS